MAKRRKSTMEFRFYEVPQGEKALVLFGESWNRPYGVDEFFLHFHNLLEIGICRRGDGEVHFDTEIHRYENDSITIIPENFPHVTISDGGEKNFWEYIFIDVRSILLELFSDDMLFQNQLLEIINKGPVMTSVSESPEIAELVNQIIREAKNKKSFGRQMREMFVKALIMEIARNNDMIPEASTLDGSTSNMAQISAALDYINRNYNSQMKAKEIAEVCGMSETHFRRVFEEYINMSPMEYVNLIRIQRACEMMKKTNDSMDEVANKCGFTTTSTFNRNFKKFLNTSPYQWKINPDNYENKLLNYKIQAMKGW